MVGEFEVLVVAVTRHHQPHDEFVTRLDHRCRLEHRPRLREPLHEELLLDREFLAARSRHVRDVVEVLPVDTPPGQPRVGLLHDDLTHGGYDLPPHEPLLEEAGPRLDLRGRHRLATNGHRHEVARPEQVRAAAKQRPHGVGRRHTAWPAARPLLRKQPRLHRFHGGGIARDLVEGLDHHGLGLDRCRRPAPPRRMLVSPPHALPRILLSAWLHVGVHRPLLQAVDDGTGRLAISRTVEREGHVPLRPPAELHPGLSAHIEPPADRFGGLVFRRSVCLKEAPREEGIGSSRREHGILDLLGPPPLLDKPAVEPGQRRHRRLDVDRYAGGPQATEAGDDRERDGIAGAAPGKPRPAAVAVPQRLEPFKGRPHLVLGPRGIEEQSDPGPGLPLVHGVADPRRFREQRLHKVGVLFERAREGVGALPLLKDLRDPRVGRGHVAGVGVGIEPGEERLDALVVLLHQAGQGEHAIPCRVRRRLHDERLAPDLCASRLE